MLVAITGANGFVGRHIAEFLEEKYIKTRRITRAETGDLVRFTAASNTPWLDGVDVLVHTAAIAHSGHKLSDAQEKNIRQVNVDAVITMAERAAAHGVAKFIFISSAHVYGRSANGVLDEDAEMLPTNLYGICKAEAENKLVALAEKNGLELIILRPPLIYGLGVKANFRALITLVDRQWPLPFAALTQARSYCYVGNLADAVQKCLRSEQGWNDIYNIADAAPISIKDLCIEIGEALRKPAFMFYFPKRIIRFLLAMIGRRHMIEALCKPLVVDTRLAKEMLHWQPPFSLKQGLEATLRKSEQPKPPEPKEKR